MKLSEVMSKYRTPDVAAVLDCVRATGQSAFAQGKNADGTLQPSYVVMCVAILRDRNPVELQAEVQRYADLLDTAE